MNEEKRGPVHLITIGRINCNIWQNPPGEGGDSVWYSVSFYRQFSTPTGYHKAQTYGRDDLLVLAEAARQAFLWIAKQQGGEGL